jgi:hypothetical protein
MVWYDPEAIANILCFKDVCERYRVEYMRDFHGSGRGAFVVEMDGRGGMVFEKSSSGRPLP